MKTPSNTLAAELLDRSPAGWLVLDSAGTFRYVNNTAAALLGAEPEELIGVQAWDRFPDAVRRAFGTHFERLLEGEERVRFEEYLQPLGVWLQVEADRIEDGIWVWLRNVTEAHSGEHALRLVLDHLPSITWTVGHDLRYTSLGGSATRLLPRERQAQLGDPLEKIVLPEEVELHRRVLAGEPVREDRTIDGRTWDIRIEPIRSAVDEVVGAAGVAFDVTNERLAFEEVRQSEQLHRLIVENADQGIWAIDANEKTTFVNPKLTRMLGYPAEEMLGRTPFDFMAEESHDAAAASLEQRRQGLSGDVDVRFRRSDGTPIEAAIHGNPLVDADGRYAGSLALVTDVTERRAAEREHEALEAQLRQSQKMETVGRLAGGMAHDFNNLLTAIGGYAQLAASRLPEGDASRKDLDEVLRGTERAADLIRQLLAFSRRQVLEPKVLDLNTAVRDLELMLRPMIGEQVDVVVSLAEELGSVKADPGQLQQVVVNLAVNARDAMPDGGRLTIATRNEVVEDDSGDVPPGAYVALVVTDDGEGIDERTQEKIFEPFFTTKALGEGTGLGLSTVDGIVNQSGGHITVHSAPGAGSTFTVYLPVTDERPAEATPPTRAEGGHAPSGETVLLLEDETVVRQLVREILERDGYNVIEAVDAETALAATESSGERVDLLVTDVVMPGMSGPEFARTLTRDRPDLKVLYMSGYSAEAVAGNGLGDPGSAFLQKPFRARELSDTVRGLLRR